MAIETTFEDKIRTYLHEGLLTGDIVPGKPVTISSMARKLQTTSALVRGVISRFQHNGVIEEITGKTFTLSKRTGDSARQVFYLTGVLEEFGLCEVEFDQPEIQSLFAAVDDLKEEKDPAERYRKDLEFHHMLMARCRNEISNELIKDLKLILFPYVIKAFEEKDYRFRTYLLYRQVVDLLEDEEWEDAGKLLRAYWKILADERIQQTEEKADKDLSS